jgi:hypothetical protein
MPVARSTHYNSDADYPFNINGLSTAKGSSLEVIFTSPLQAMRTLYGGEADDKIILIEVDRGCHAPAWAFSRAIRPSCRRDEDILEARNDKVHLPLV